ncbi:MAG: PDZ domain-containing protein [Synechococcales cyanobacterium RM1_1_8]|nr:PDZ domain-containing protein [Synechococcales cyanobacterium RM1_1_8]
MVVSKTKLAVGALAAVAAAATLAGTGIHWSKGQPLLAGTGISWSKGRSLLAENPQELIDEVWQIIDNDYVDGTFNQVDWRQVRSAYLNREYSDQPAAYEAIREMLDKLGDPYTRFMDPSEYGNLKIDTSGELTGVGIQLTQDEETKELIVVAPIEDTPAFEAGVKSRDVIIKVDGQSTEGMTTDDAVKLIRGPVNSSVMLTVRRDSQTPEGKVTSSREIEFKLLRALIEIHPVKFSDRTDQGLNVGYIRLNQFNANAASEMRDAIQQLELKNVDGYVLDLRSNPGGLLYSSIEIARMWIGKGTIVSTVNRRGTADVEQANGRSLTDAPLVVLVDGGSASASEILSGALRDNERATLVGTKTFGKGLVQSVRPLGDGSGLAVTIAKYLTPDGTDINKEGITPDVLYELSETEQELLSKNRELIGTVEDPQYAKALEALKQAVSTAKAGRTASES